jgi:histidinol-phosphatase
MPAHDLGVALAAADRADAITMAAFTGRALAFTRKADGSPVTDSDRQVEQALRAEFAAHRPDYGFVGEETGSTGPASPRWIVDPIDGTRDFTAGGRRWATQIALEIDGGIVVGVTSAPALGARWWAARGVGAYNDTPTSAGTGRLQVSAVDDPQTARWTCSPPISELGTPRPPLVECLDQLGTYVPASSHGALMVAEGEIEVCLQLEGAPWDYGAFAAIVETAGGTFSYLDGSHRLAGVRPAVFTNGRLHARTLDVLRSA